MTNTSRGRAGNIIRGNNEGAIKLMEVNEASLVPSAHPPEALEIPGVNTTADEDTVGGKIITDEMRKRKKALPRPMAAGAPEVHE